MEGKWVCWLVFGFVVSLGVVEGAPWSGYARVGKAGALDAPFYLTVRKDRIEGLLFRLDSHERFEVRGKVSRERTFRARLMGKKGGVGRLTGAVLGGRLTASGKIKIGSSQSALLRLRSKIRSDERERPNLEGRYFLMGGELLNETSYVNLRKIGDTKGAGRYEFDIDMNSSHDALDLEMSGVTPESGKGAITLKNSYYPWEPNWDPLPWYYDPDFFDYFPAPYYPYPYYPYYYYPTHGTDVRVESEIVVETREGKVTEKLEGYRLP